jgi:hypothetical protein
MAPARCIPEIGAGKVFPGGVPKSCLSGAKTGRRSLPSPCLIEVPQGAFLTHSRFISHYFFLFIDIKYTKYLLQDLGMKWERYVYFDFHCIHDGKYMHTTLTHNVFI